MHHISISMSLICLSSSILGNMTWIEICEATGPGIRICAGMVYDSESNVMVLHGGFDGSGASDETWVFNCSSNEWMLMHSDNSPTGRFGQGFVYDDIRDRCVMFFGTNGTDYFDDTWEYDYNLDSWTRLQPISSPSPRCKGGAAFDSQSGQIVFFGGYGPNVQNLSETWAFDFNDNIWMNRTTMVTPPARKRNALCYDADDDMIVMFGGWLEGCTVLGDTWIYDVDSNEWMEIHPAASPEPRARFATVYDPSTGNVVISHGFYGTGEDLDDTWEFSFEDTIWIQIPTDEDRMPARHCFQMAFDTIAGRIIGQGGSDVAAFESGTWALDIH